MSDFEASRYEQHRANALAELKRRGFEDGKLQILWRTPECFTRTYDMGEVIAAICDALTREGCTAWSGDGTSCVEQMIRLQWDRAVKAETELAKLRAALPAEHAPPDPEWLPQAIAASNAKVVSRDVLRHFLRVALTEMQLARTQRGGFQVALGNHAVELERTQTALRELVAACEQVSWTKLAPDDREGYWSFVASDAVKQARNVLEDRGSRPALAGRGDETPETELVADFGVAMATQLRAASRRGKSGWEYMTPKQLLRRAEQELGELRSAVEKNAPALDVVHEAADVGNFCAMLAAVYDQR